MTEKAFVTGSNVLPGNPAVVHHAILYVVAPDQVAAAERHDAATAGRGWTCFGGGALPNAAGVRGRSPRLGAVAGGLGARRRRDGLPRRRRQAAGPGSRIVLQLHYNLREGTDARRHGGPAAARCPGTADLQPLQTMLLVAPVELPCAPGESGPLCDRSRSMLDLVSRFGESRADGRRAAAALRRRTSSRRARVRRRLRPPGPQALVVRAVAGHMHLLGRSITVDLVRDGGTSRRCWTAPCGTSTTRARTPLDRPVRVRPGDRLRVTCTHDASLRSMVPELADEQPRYVTWGEGTSDEMCLGIVLYTRA